MQGKCPMRNIEQHLNQYLVAGLQAAENPLECRVTHPHCDHQFGVLGRAGEREEPAIALAVGFVGIDQRHPHMLPSLEAKALRLLEHESPTAFRDRLLVLESHLKRGLLYRRAPTTMHATIAFVIHRCPLLLKNGFKPKPAGESCCQRQLADEAKGHQGEHPVRYWT